MTIEAQIAQISKNMDRLAAGLKKEIQENKAIKRKASRFAIAVMKNKAPMSTKEYERKGKLIQPGALKKSIAFLNLSKSQDVFFGPKAKIAPHGHLAEYGFIHHKDKSFVEGKHYVRKTYDETKQQILTNLIALSKTEFERLGRNIDG